MKQITPEGKEVRYWDFAVPVKATVTKEDGSTEEKIIAHGDWIRKPVNVSVSAPETLDEALQVAGNDENRLCELIAKGLELEASEKGGIAPEGTFSKAMVSAVVKGVKAMPQFKALQRKDLTLAVMRWISGNEVLKTSFLTAYEGLRTAVAEEDED